ncbi:dirigent protein 1-like [Panicum miliaceum]|uniref:Dirigent protein n=1 Tax=Panicum miliaceum TaxID=4540 RepID=A0A3L6TC70_PANMI|nr:dirigent protein 1-like [Panicum miliaceum]
MAAVKQATSAAAVFLLLLAVLMVAPPAAVLAADDDGTTHLSFFMHDIVSGSNPTAVQVIKGPGGSTTAAPALGMSFGDTMVMDDALTETSSPTSVALGRMQGFYMLSSQSGPVLMVCANLLLTSGDHNGSTVAVLGRDDTAADVRELAVVGGTGKFRMARGYVLWKTSSMKGADATVQLDVYLTTGNATTIDAAAPVSPADGSGSSGSGSSGSGSKASGAGATRTGGGWVSARAVAVVVAVVGSSWVW